MLGGKISIFLPYMQGQIPKPFFDTQIAAALWSGITALSRLCELGPATPRREAGESHIPLPTGVRDQLSDDQIAYALEDVEFLLSIHTRLQDRLSTLGPLECVQ